MQPAIARRILTAALSVGVAGDLVFDGSALGLNILAAAFAMFLLVTLYRPPGARIDPLDLWLPPVGLAAAAAVVLRSDPIVVALDVTLAGCALGAWAIAVTGRAVTRSGASTVTVLGLATLGAVGAGALSSIPAAVSGGFLPGAWSAIRRIAPALRGALLAVPAVLVFGALFASADPVFRHYVDAALTLPVDLSDLARRAAIVLVVGWVVAGLLAVAAAWSPMVAPGPRPVDADIDRTAPRRRQGATEAVVVLVAVEFLFGLFVALQFGYLFGGLDTLVTAGLTYSDYARQGYFQLVAVVLLAGVLVGLIERRAGRTRRFLVAALGFVGLTTAVLASAALRLGLYLQAYGWTELRFYVAVSIGWLALGAGFVVLLLIRDRMRWLVHGMAFTAIALTLGLSVIGPQAFITDRNLDRILDPRLVPPDGESGFDALYLATFSDDAVPALVAALERLEPSDRAVVLAALSARRADLAADPTTRGAWAWNLSRERARATLSELPTPWTPDQHERRRYTGR